MIFKTINTTINTNRSKLIMNYRHNCHKIRSIFNFIVSTTSIINTKTKTFYVNVTLINRFHKRRNKKITCSHVFLKFLFIIEREFHYNASLQRFFKANNIKATRNCDSNTQWQNLRKYIISNVKAIIIVFEKLYIELQKCWQYIYIVNCFSIKRLIQKLI